MKQRLTAAAVLLLISACSRVREDKTIRGGSVLEDAKVSRGDKKAVRVSDGGLPGVREISLLELRKRFLEMMPDKKPKDKEEVMVLRFVDDYVKKQYPSIKHRMLLIEEREKGKWRVSVTDLSLIMRGGRDGGITVVVERHGEGFRVLRCLL